MLREGPRCHFGVATIAFVGLIYSEATSAAEMSIVRLSPGAVLETYVDIRGPINVGDWSDFNRLLRTNPDIAGVALSSGGGSLDDGMAIAKQIYDRKFDTVLVDVCHSVCAIMFLAGDDKYAPVSFRLTVHTAYKQIGDWTLKDHIANGTVTWFLGHMGYPLPLARLWVATGQEAAAPVTWAHNYRWNLGFRQLQFLPRHPRVIDVTTPP